MSLFLGSGGNNGVIPTSSAGPQGPPGDPGAAGAQGPQGDIGAQGATGPQGMTGPQGTAGAAGGTGPQGTQGNTGSTGPQGDQGATGATGSQGPQGDPGDSGSTLGDQRFINITTFTASVDNWAPSAGGLDWDDADGIIIDAASTTITITGFQAPTASGKKRKIVKADRNTVGNIVLSDEDSSSSAANRIDVSIADTAQDQEGWIMVYDFDGSRWVTISSQNTA